MTTIPELIQETEKGCNRQDICGGLNCGKRKDGLLCNDCKAKLSALKQCQTIAEEKLKEEIRFLDRLEHCNNTTSKEWLKTIIEENIIERRQQLNPAQTKDD